MNGKGTSFSLPGRNDSLGTGLRGTGVLIALAVALAGLAIPVGGSALAAPAKVYWVRNYPTRTYPIERCAPDGSNRETLIDSVPRTYGIDVDDASGKMYWARSYEIERANVDGTSRESFITNINPRDVAVDLVNDKLYWCNYTYADPEIRRANLDGTGMETIVNGLPDGCDLQGIAVDPSAGKVYWIERFEDRIRRANLDGSSVETLLVCADGISNVYGIDVAGGMMYWTDFGAGCIYRADPTNAADTKTEMVTGLDEPCHLAVDASSDMVYWASKGGSMIRRANVDGGTVVIDDLTPANIYNAWGVALGGTALPEVTIRSISVVQGSAVLDWGANTNGLLYCVESCAALTDDWCVVAPTSQWWTSDTSWTNSSATGTVRYFRVKARYE